MSDTGDDAWAPTNLFGQSQQYWRGHQPSRASTLHPSAVFPLSDSGGSHLRSLRIWRMTNIMKKIAILPLAATVLAMSAVQEIQAQPAPIPRVVVSEERAPERMTSMFAALESGDRAIQIEGAQWLQLQFSDFRLGDGQLRVRSAVDEQTFTQDQLEAWEGLTAVFNGSEITITLTPGTSSDISAKVGDVIIGLPGTSPEFEPSIVWQSLIDFLGGDLQRFIPTDAMRQPEGSNPGADFAPEAICGFEDNRVASRHPAAGRIMPIGCTGWIITDGRLLTAGHCIRTSAKTVEFNVPVSTAHGTTVSPPVRDQYRVIAASIKYQNRGVGNDWAVFKVLPNTQTGLTPIAAQKAFFEVSNAAKPATVRIAGYGVDGPAPKFGSGKGAPRNSDNQTQQTHAGKLTENTGGAKRGTLRYNVDTQGGNSGSPVIVEGTNQTIGIHTHGGCSSSGGTNAGTSFRNQALWNATRRP